jgi:hypothetical protein
MKNPVVMQLHCHPGDQEMIDASKARKDIDKQASSSRDRPRQLIASAAQQLPVNVFVKLGKPDTVKRTIQRKRRGKMPMEPHTLQVPNNAFFTLDFR